jgi:RsiW-degrading membrane proteinase PrsW (M82 family)
MASEQPLPSGGSRFQLSRSTVFPLVGGRSTWSQEHLLPIFATVLVSIALIAVLNPGTVLTGKDEIAQAWQVYFIIAIYIAFMVDYYINQMCGRAKGLWLIAAVALFTLLLLDTPIWRGWYVVFYNVIPAEQWQKSSNVVVQLAGWLFGTGLCEESFKALPLFVLAFLGAGLALLARHTKGRLRAFLAGMKKRVGLSEPLDGIVLGVASGSGFFINETLGQYVPGVMSQAKYAGTQAFDGLVLLLSRGLPELVEHSAWSGLFGYFIGLAVLRPGMAIYLLPLGWLSAAALHAGWDGISAVSNSGALILGSWLFLGVLSYALLGGAIFKAREISPTRGLNFADGRTPQDASLSPALVPATAPAPRSDASDWD